MEITIAILTIVVLVLHEETLVGIWQYQVFETGGTHHFVTPPTPVEAFAVLMRS